MVTIETVKELVEVRYGKKVIEGFDRSELASYLEDRQSLIRLRLLLTALVYLLIRINCGFMHTFHFFLHSNKVCYLCRARCANTYIITCLFRL